jgi:hypothetical protein
VDAVTFLTNILNKASNHFTMGQRAFYFALPVMAWVVDPRAFIAITLVLLLYLALLLDFRRWKPPFPLRSRDEEWGPGPAQPPTGPARRGSAP